MPSSGMPSSGKPSGDVAQLHASGGVARSSKLGAGSTPTSPQTLSGSLALSRRAQHKSGHVHRRLITDATPL